MPKHSLTRTLALCLLSALAPSLADASDGVIEINQAKALAGEVTAGDAEGFPVTISEPGSYILTGNLTVAEADTSGIVILADDVTVDLNGFTIAGPLACTGPPNSGSVTCSGSADGAGVTGEPTGYAPENIVVRNGVVRGFGGSGVAYFFGRIEQVRVISNRIGISIPIGLAINGNAPGTAIVDCWIVRNEFSGIEAGDRALVKDNVVQSNGSVGIRASGDSVIVGNTVDANEGSSGIDCSGCMISGNTVTNNLGVGISGGFSLVRSNTVLNNTGLGLSILTSGFVDNVISGNGATVNPEAISLGANSCNGTSVCP